jgi:hypothetical protein
VIRQVARTVGGGESRSVFNGLQQPGKRHRWQPQAQRAIKDLLAQERPQGPQHLAIAEMLLKLFVGPQRPADSRIREFK